MIKENEDLICPIDGSKFKSLSNKRIQFENFKYPVKFGIPCLFVEKDENKVNLSKLNNVKNFYTKYSFPNYNDFDDIQLFLRKTKDHHLSKLISEQIGENKKILEIGCGTGQLTNYLAATTFSKNAYGTDLSINSLKLANDFKKRNQIDNIKFVQMNLFKPCFKKNSMDLVISNGVIHHTYNPEKGFATVSDLVKPGGYLIISLYNYLGRLITLINKFFYKIFGNKGLIFDKYLNSNISKRKKISWTQDQYNHPVESLHSMGEVLEWFKKKEISFVSSIPKIHGKFDISEKIFKEQSEGDFIDRFNTQFEMIFNYQSQEGGLFTMIGKKKIKS